MKNLVCCMFFLCHGALMVGSAPAFPLYNDEFVDSLPGEVNVVARTVCPLCETDSFILPCLKCAQEFRIDLTKQPQSVPGLNVQAKSFFEPGVMVANQDVHRAYFSGASFNKIEDAIRAEMVSAVAQEYQHIDINRLDPVYKTALEVAISQRAEKRHKRLVATSFTDEMHLTSKMEDALKELETHYAAECKAVSLEYINRWNYIALMHQKEDAIQQRKDEKQAHELYDLQETFFESAAGKAELAQCQDMGEDSYEKALERKKNEIKNKQKAMLFDRYKRTRSYFNRLKQLRANRLRFAALIKNMDEQLKPLFAEKIMQEKAKQEIANRQPAVGANRLKADAQLKSFTERSRSHHSMNQRNGAAAGMTRALTDRQHLTVVYGDSQAASPTHSPSHMPAMRMGESPTLVSLPLPFARGQTPTNIATDRSSYWRPSTMSPLTLSDHTHRGNDVATPLAAKCTVSEQVSPIKGDVMVTDIPQHPKPKPGFTAPSANVNANTNGNSGEGAPQGCLDSCVIA